MRPVLDLFFGRKLQQETDRYLQQLVQSPILASRQKAAHLLVALEAEPGPHVLLGETAWGESVHAPLDLLVKAHAIITGGTGCGKTMAALALIDAILSSLVANVSFGVLDAKGELFERTLYLIARKLEALPPTQARALAERLVIVDLASPDPLSSYNIAHPWSGSDLEFFTTTRIETLQELLPSGDGFSVRGSSIVRHVLKLLAGHRLPFSYFDRVLSSEPFRSRLLSASRDDELRYYFQHHFPNEGRATIAAVRARIASMLFTSESLRLALSGPDAPDFTRLQDEAKIVLINCAGTNIPRATAKTLQALFLSDLRSAVFARKTRAPYLWVCDEAQNFFRTRHLRDHMVDLLTMSRSFGSFFLCLTQNLSTAVQDNEILETLYTNIRWSLTMRGTSRDGGFLKPALPVTGRKLQPQLDPFQEKRFYSASEERGMALDEIAHLPDRVGYFWLRTRSAEALKIKTRELRVPQGRELEEATLSIRRDPHIGGRLSQSEYERMIAERDRVWAVDPESNLSATLAEAYRRVR